ILYSYFQHRRVAYLLHLFLRDSSSVNKKPNSQILNSYIARMPRPTRAHPEGDRSAAAQMYALNTQFQSNRNRRVPEPSVAPPRAGPSFPGGVDALSYTPALPSPFLRPSGPRQQLHDRTAKSVSNEDADGVGGGGDPPKRASRVPFWQTMDNSDDEFGSDYTLSRRSLHSQSSGYNASNYHSDFGDFSFLLEENPDLAGGKVLGSTYVDPNVGHHKIAQLNSPSSQNLGGDDMNDLGFAGDDDVEGPPPSPSPALEQRFPEDDELSGSDGEEEWLGIGNQVARAEDEGDGYRSSAHATPIRPAGIAAGKKRAS
ncbi:hypothetical protein EV361DRAFT_215049, partial [Lentinula raphanica]